jgi:hypothetical protein
MARGQCASASDRWSLIGWVTINLLSGDVGDVLRQAR